MAFLAWLGRVIVEFTLVRVVALVRNAVLAYQKRKQVSDEAHESVKPLKDAKTAEEIDHAADQALDKL